MTSKKISAATLALAMLLLAACSSTPVAATDHPGFVACTALLEAQNTAWNRGDIKTFAEGYRKSPNLVFAGRTSVDLGFDQMLARYQRGYPTAERMGQLTFSDLRFTALGSEEVTCTGAWQLARAGDTPHGHFVLVFALFPEGWRIVLDYTTVGD